RVQRLLADLGSDVWIDRHRAQVELMKLGKAAIDKVKPLENHPDPEVAFRVRQILEAYKVKMDEP
ncbi:MAG: hypothetical protein ACPGYV_09690, partial [Phycisphaeraceae bacterium]